MLSTKTEIPSQVGMLLFLFLSFFSTFAARQPLTIQGDLQRQKLLGKHLTLYLDTTNKLQAPHIIKLMKQPNFEWDANSSPYNGGILGKNLWMYFEIADSDSISDFFYLEVPDFHVNYTELYVVAGDSLQFQGANGYSISRAQTMVNYKNPTYIINPKHQKGYLMKMNSSFGSSYKLYVSSPTAKMNSSLNEYLRFGAYYGILFIMLIYNLLMFVLTKERSHVYYVMYVAACIWYSFFTDGLGFQYLWPAYPVVNAFYSYALVLLLFSYIVYSAYFLKLKTRLPLAFKFLLFSLLLYVLVFTYSTFLSPIHQVSTWAFALPYIIIVVAAVSLYRKGYKEIRFFILAYGVLALSVIVHTLMGKGLFPDNFFGIYALNIGFVFEVIFLSFAQGDRIRLSNLERIQAQKHIIDQQRENELLKEKVNRELELLVAKRTQELQVKNEELIQNNQEIKLLNEQINRMNAQLDKNVWQLKKEVKESSKLKITDKNVSYEEFQSVFQGDFSCYKHLEALKWGDGFMCKKCGNDKWNSAEPHIARKCTKCDYNESVTSGTLFHRTKIPLQKAFYIANTVFKGASLTTLELSKQLDLRLNTCADFRKKVSLKMEEDKPTTFDQLLVS